MAPAAEVSQAMPLLTLVVPAYRVQGYLRICLDSILTQSFADFEVIAVDDCSPDHTGQILDEFAARDARVQVIHLAANAGLGPARNVALDRAAGEYVWFVDSDDWIAPGALRAIAGKLHETEPDVLMVDHVRVDWRGRQWRSRSGRFLAAMDGPHCFTIADAPELVRLHTVAWNKVVRRRFLLDSGLDFPAGWYEDLPFTYPILVAAGRVAALSRVCYHYRRRRRDAITRTRSTRHFEVFDQYQRVFDRLAVIGERSAPVLGLIFDRMVWHYFVIQSQPDRLPRSQRRAFFRRMSEHYRRFRPDQHPPPADALSRLRHRLIAADAYRTFRMLRRLRRSLLYLRRQAHRARRLLVRLTRRTAGGARLAIGRTYYHIQLRRPRDRRLAVYAAYWYRGFACNPAAIYQSAREVVPSIHGLWVVSRRHRDGMPPGVPYVVDGTLPYYRALARATWLVNNVNFPDFVVKRRGSVHLQTHHGTPVKVMGVEQGAYPIGAGDLDIDALIRRSDRWDFSLSANRHTTEVWHRAYPCRYETLEYGYPRTDRLVRADAREVAAVRAGLGISPHQTVILYAPTHRDYVEGYRPLLDLEELADNLTADHLLLQRIHYYYTRAARPRHPRVRDVSAPLGIEDLLLASDVLITDYSSVIFDYAVLDRPIVLHAPDWEAYRVARGVTFDLLAEPPGVVTTTPADLADAFRSGAVASDAATKLRSQFRSRFCYLEDGHAGERVARRVFAGHG